MFCFVFGGEKGFGGNGKNYFVPGKFLAVNHRITVLVVLPREIHSRKFPTSHPLFNGTHVSGHEKKKQSEFVSG